MSVNGAQTPGPWSQPLSARRRHAGPVPPQARCHGGGLGQGLGGGRGQGTDPTEDPTDLRGPTWGPQGSQPQGWTSIQNSSAVPSPPPGDRPSEHPPMLPVQSGGGDSSVHRALVGVGCCPSDPPRRLRTLWVPTGKGLVPRQPCGPWLWLLRPGLGPTCHPALAWPSAGARAMAEPLSPQGPPLWASLSLPPPEWGSASPGSRVCPPSLHQAPSPRAARKPSDCRLVLSSRLTRP